MNQIEVRGMVISAMPIGEFDKRLVLLTREKGKITVFAKGARRQNSPFLAGSRPFSFGTFTIYAGRSSYGLTGITISEYFLKMTADITMTYYGFYFLELADYFSKEGLDAKDTLNLLYAAFRAIEKQAVPLPLIRSIYELKMMVLQGIYPDFFSCRHCGRKTELHWYEAQTAGIYCDACKIHSKQTVKLQDSTVYALQYIMSQPIDRLFSFQVIPAVQAQLEQIIGQFVKRYVDKPLNSLSVLETLTAD